MFRNLAEEFVSQIDLCGEAENVSEAAELIPVIKPDLVVVDSIVESESGSVLIDLREEHVFGLCILGDYHSLPIKTEASVDTLTRPVNVEGLRHLARKLSSR